MSAVNNIENPESKVTTLFHIISAILTTVYNSSRRIWVIAVYTWREGIRKKTLVGFLILSLLVIFGSSFLTSFMHQTTVGESEADIDVKLIKDICVTTISLFGVLITIFISAAVVPNEVENKVIYTVLSKPVRRAQYLLGKFIGVQLIVIANLLLMGGLFFVALYLKQGLWPTLLLWSLLLTYFEFLIVSAFTFAIGCTSTSAVLPTIGGLFIYLTGNLTGYLENVKAASGQSGDWLDAMIGNVAQGLFYILPNLQDFSLKAQILDSLPNDPPTDILIPWLILYSLIYATTGWLIAYLIFFRKEL